MSRATDASAEVGRLLDALRDAKDIHEVQEIQQQLTEAIDRLNRLAPRVDMTTHEPEPPKEIKGELYVAAVRRKIGQRIHADGPRGSVSWGQRLTWCGRKQRPRPWKRLGQIPLSSISCQDCRHRIALWREGVVDPYEG